MIKKEKKLGGLKMGKDYRRVNVYKNGNVVARVKYNSDLDFWDGRNWSNGGTGKHLGITKLKNGEFVLIRGSDWQGERDYAEIVSADEALQAILKSNNLELFERKKFKDLKILAEKEKLIDEDDE
jgi:hypothetical protein